MFPSWMRIPYPTQAPRNMKHIAVQLQKLVAHEIKMILSRNTARQGVELQALVFKSGKKRKKTRGTIHRHKTPRIATLDDLSNGRGGGYRVTGENNISLSPLLLILKDNSREAIVPKH